MTVSFPTYDYKDGFQRIENILKQPIDKDEEKEIPADHDLTFSNGYTCWTSAIFVDIRDSTTLFSSKDIDMVSRMVRSFTSEVIEILMPDTAAEVGIRGDCVYGIYSTPKMIDVCSVYDRAIYINTLVKLLNKEYSKKKYPTMNVGIGLAVNKDLVIKAGRKGSGINSKVWIGNAVTTASNLSSYGSKNGISSIVMSSIFYSKIENQEKTKNSEFVSWFKKCQIDNNIFYHGNIIKINFKKWIDELK